MASTLALLKDVPDLRFQVQAICTRRTEVLRACQEQFGWYGTQGSLQAKFTDNEPGRVRVVFDKSKAAAPLVKTFEPERDRSAYGHGAAVIRYLRHFQECLEADREPSPNVLDGAKSVAAGAAAWESVRTGAEVKAQNDF